MSTVDEYLRFGRREVRGRSPAYERLCQAVAGDRALIAALETLPEPKRQPNLLFAAVRHLGGPVLDAAAFLDWTTERFADVAAVMLERRTQTNEVGRCAPLLPVLGGLPQPLALLEVGASAGLCLYIDRYHYDYGGIEVGPAESRVRLACATEGPVPVPRRVPQVAWRAGLDVNPLDVRDDEDMRWLEMLIWPEQEHRLARLRAAVAVARADPPLLVCGDLRTDLPGLAAQAPADATLVVFHASVLGYVSDGRDRQSFVDQVTRCRGTGSRPSYRRVRLHQRLRRRPGQARGLPGRCAHRPHHAARRLAAVAVAASDGLVAITELVADHRRNGSLPCRPRRSANRTTFRDRGHGWPGMSEADGSRWRDPTWLAQAYEWIDSRLGELGRERTGPIEQPHVYPWSTVLHVPTAEGSVWFKANEEALRYEVAVLERIAARRPEVVPALLAGDPTTGWMLLADAGEPLRALVERERSLDRWHEVLPLYAGVQRDLAADVDHLLAAGVPDRRLATLPSAYERLMDEIGAEQRFREAVPMVAELCAELAAFGLPELLQHDDLHDGQVFVRDGRYLLLDWGDACISHPFFTLSVTLEGVLAWGLDDVENSVDIAPFRDSYLAAFADRDPAELVAAARIALRLGWACRAVNGHVQGDDERTLTRLRMFLDGRP